MVRAAGRTLTLDEVEHQVIRKEFHEPRIHFALVCAAVSCPPLRREAYTGGRLDEQLDAQARAFLASPERNRVDAASRTVFLSPVFGWYREDFGGTDEALGRLLAPLLPGRPREDAPRVGTLRAARNGLRLVPERDRRCRRPVSGRPVPTED